MMDQPITLRTVLGVVLFVVFFPFSVPFVFPKTCLLLVGLLILPLTIVPAREPATPMLHTPRESQFKLVEAKSEAVIEEDCPLGLAEDKKSCWFPVRVDMIPEGCSEGHWSVRQICELQNR